MKKKKKKKKKKKTPFHQNWIEIENAFSHFTALIIVLQENCIELKLQSFIMSISYCHYISNNLNIYEENYNFIKKINA